MSVRDLTDPEILNHLKNNTILRNKQLSVLVKLLNSIDIGSTFAIDGAWGSGKTVFVRQLQMLVDETIEDYGRNTIDDSEISKLREEQEMIYFNAWENDYISDALGAILLKLIADSGEGLNEAAIRRALSMLDPSAAIKKLTHDFVDLDGKPKKDKLIEQIKPLIDRHEAVNELLDAIKARRGKKRLIFIIDELDRCRPSFAMDLLEVIKHYFARDDITFIITANLRELSHTVKKYYGHEFNSDGYLNKFFDFTFGLNKVDIHNYARNVLNWGLGDTVDSGVARDAINHYKFEMREVNAYSSSLRLINKFLTKSSNYQHEQFYTQLIFVPLALALKIKDIKKYTVFASGEGEEVLVDFLNGTDEAVEYVMPAPLNAEKATEQREEAIQKLTAHYKVLFSPQGRRGGRDFLEDFYDAISLIGSYTTLDEGSTS